VKEGMRAGRSHSLRNAAAVAILAIGAATSLTACVEQHTNPAPTSTAGDSGETTAQDNHDENPHDAGEVAQAPEADRESQAAALDAATLALETFARTDLDYDTWWAELLPMLTEQAGVAYEGTDPAEIPVHKVTGPGVVLEGSTEVSLIVQLPTDAGPYNVTLTRPSAAAAWLADRIRPANA
jgi:hypothetical protein